MKITAIRAFPVWVGIRNQLLVKVETDEGIYGWGESRPVRPREGRRRRHRALSRVPHRPRSDADRRALAGDVPQPVFRGRPRAHRGDLRDRHRAPRHQGQGARRAGLPAARRQAARPHSDLRHHPRAAGPGDDRGGEAADRARAGTASACSPAGHENTRRLRAARAASPTTARVVRRRRARRSATRSSSASTITTG